MTILERARTISPATTMLSPRMIYNPSSMSANLPSAKCRSRVPSSTRFAEGSPHGSHGAISYITETPRTDSRPGMGSRRRTELVKTSHRANQMATVPQHNQQFLCQDHQISPHSLLNEDRLAMRNPRCGNERARTNVPLSRHEGPSRLCVERRHIMNPTINTYSRLFPGTSDTVALSDNETKRLLSVRSSPG